MREAPELQHNNEGRCGCLGGRGTAGAAAMSSPRASAVVTSPLMTMEKQAWRGLGQPVREARGGGASGHDGAVRGICMKAE